MKRYLVTLQLAYARITLGVYAKSHMLAGDIVENQFRSEDPMILSIILVKGE